MAKKVFYGKGIPGADPSELPGLLIVIEGADGSGRTTQSELLRDWLGHLGYPTTEVGLKRSMLVGPEIEEAMQGNTLGPRTMSLFYATDFADQLEHIMMPSLRAGFVVIADRYFYTLMARDLVRGADARWLKSLYGIALKPDIVLYLRTSPRQLAERSFYKHGALDYWESGMDIERSGDMYQCFVRYQTKLQREFDQISKEYGFQEVDGDRDPLSIHRDIQVKLAGLIGKKSLSRQSANVGIEASRASDSAVPENAKNLHRRPSKSATGATTAKSRKRQSGVRGKSAGRSVRKGRR